MNNTYDVIVIGAGAVGCAIARELSRYSIRALVLEKECDVAYGTSGRMSGVVHAGFNNKTGTAMDSCYLLSCDCPNIVITLKKC